MSKVQKAKELVGKAMELKGSKTQFLREFASPMREEINKIKYDRMLSGEGRREKLKELKEKETKKFMQQVALRKQAYQHYLSNAKKLAKETIEENVVFADDATRAKFNRGFAELKFKIALLDENRAYNEVKSFVDKTPDHAYATLLMENFHEIAGKFSVGEHKLGLSKAYDKLKVESTPEEVAEAYDVIEQVDGSIHNKMFTLIMPGDNPASNPEYSIISELFSQDAVRYYQEPEVYFAKQDEPLPEFVDPDGEKVLEKKAPADPEYANFMREIADLKKKLEDAGAKFTE